ncbi:MAG TPA: FAD-dependent oxidoreductase [Dermatophilaceae bacterium]|nr:FAD-dependent oxidoreductase [Dermatophilaceae bacterium]
MSSALPGHRRPSVAVVGAGVSGLTAAYLLARTHDVTLLEADRRFGGHAHTHEVDTPHGRQRVDSGFIVHNERTYPVLLRLFAELGVATRPTEMSMSITCEQCGLSYAGGKGPAGILASPTRLVDPRFGRLLAEVPRFHRRARAVLSGDSDPAQTWGEFLREGRFAAYTVSHFAIPLVACVWSSGDEDALDYPARHLFDFLEHHGMLSIGGSPTWRTVVGGSARYVERIVERLPDARLGAPVRAVERHDDGVDVRLGDGSSHTYDSCVLATHADTALDLLADATPDEKALLGAIHYSRNETRLHRDGSLLPTGRARASWNYRMRRCAAGADRVVVSYDLNRLMGLPGAGEPGGDLVVTLNAPAGIDPAATIATMTYDHPVFTTEAVAAAATLRAAGGPRLAFAGAHLGWGFHEDGARSGVAAAERLGGGW